VSVDALFALKILVDVMLFVR